METLEEMKKLWNESKFADSCATLTPEYADQLVAGRIKKIKSGFREYFWASFVYQNLVYASLAFLIVRYFNNTNIVILSIAGIVLYLPFTIIFMKKFKSAFLQNSGGEAFSNDDIYLNIRNSYKRMSEFLKFKNRFDWVMIPLNCILIVVINFILFVPGGIKAYPLAAVVLLIVWLVIFIIAIHYENRKKFREPLRQMETILEDFKE